MASRSTTAGSPEAEPFAPPLPPGRSIQLPGRGRTFVRELAGPSAPPSTAAPTLLLLHGWTATADLNWFTSYETLGRSFRVVALDLRGHGRGIRSFRPFRMRDCADDAAALVTNLGTGPVIAVGYSMGGAVAQLLWRRHPELVAGLVLCATSASFAGGTQEKLGFSAMGALSLASRAVPGPVQRNFARRVVGSRPDHRSIEAWATGEMQRNDWSAVLGAGSALGRFDSRTWLGEVDVPTSVVLTTNDHVVAPASQRALAAAIPGATVHPVPGDHTVCATNPGRFVPTLLSACDDVARRSRG